MNMLNEETMKKLWSGLFADWAEVRDTDNDISWRKSCPLMTVYLFESRDENKKWLVEVLDAGAQVIYEHILLAAERGPAMMEANELISEIVGSGFHAATGFASKMTQPYTEVRFKQIAADSGGQLYGLDANGVVYNVRGSLGWAAVPMNRYDHKSRSKT